MGQNSHGCSFPGPIVSQEWGDLILIEVQVKAIHRQFAIRISLAQVDNTDAPGIVIRFRFKPRGVIIAQERGGGSGRGLRDRSWPIGTQEWEVPGLRYAVLTWGKGQQEFGS